MNQNQSALWVGKFDHIDIHTTIANPDTFILFLDLDEERIKNTIDTQIELANNAFTFLDNLLRTINPDFNSSSVNSILKNKDKNNKVIFCLVFNDIFRADISNIIDKFFKNKIRIRCFKKNILATLNENSSIQDFIEGESSTDSMVFETKKLQSNTTDNLEEKFKTQTLDIKMFVDEQNLKLTSERKLIKLIKDLSELGDINDLLVVLRKELKTFSYVREPTLIYTLDGSNIFFSQMRNLNREEWLQKFNLIWPEQFAVVKGQGLSDWVKVFNRPISKLLILPFRLDLSKRFFPNAKAMLLVEDLSGSDANLQVHQFLQDRQQILSMSLDRILIEYQLSLFSYRWEKVFDNLKDPVAVIDSNFNVLRSNQAFARHTQVKTHKCYNVFANRVEPCVGCPMSQKNSVKNEVIQIGTNNYRLMQNKIEDSESENSIFFHRYYDETNHKQVLRTLFQFEKMSSLGELSGHLAHELNNPLSGIMGLAQVLQQSPEISNQIKKDLSEIENGAKRSLEIIKNLMEFTNQNSSSLSENLQLVSIDECVEKTIPLLKTALRQHRLFVDLKSKDYKVKLVPSMFQQVVFNLIQNASQATKDHGSIKIWSEIDLQKNSVRLFVEDNGEGIADENKERIFDAFYTTKTEGFGTGLGLSLCKQVVEKFEGKISVESKLHEFTRFKIVLPFFKDDKLEQIQK